MNMDTKTIQDLFYQQVQELTRNTMVHAEDTFNLQFSDQWCNT